MPPVGPWMEEILGILEGCDKETFCPPKIRDKAMLVVRSQNDNKTCFDCGVRNPSWMSLTLGIFLCLECCGDHRSMGVHLTFVRSATLDDFTPMQIIHTACGGNTRCREFFRNNGMSEKRKSCGNEGGKVVYNGKAAGRYRAQMCQDANTWGTKGNFVPANGPPLKSPLATPRPGDSSTPAAYSTQPVPSISNPNIVCLTPSKVAPSVAQTIKVDIPQAKPAEPTNVVVASSTVLPQDNRPAYKAPVVGGAAKPKAKELDFDFDFDDFEKAAGM